MKKYTVILPYQDNKVLMQLRDEKAEIVYPGHWGFFGGAIEDGELPMQSAKRELYEEIRYVAEEIFVLSIDRLIVPHEMLLYSFYCLLKAEIEELELHEGFDFGLFTLEQIRSSQLFSNKTNKMYPVVDHTLIDHHLSLMNPPYVEYLVEKLLQKITDD